MVPCKLGYKCNIIQKSLCHIPQMQKIDQDRRNRHTDKIKLACLHVQRICCYPFRGGQDVFEKCEHEQIHSDIKLLTVSQSIFLQPIIFRLCLYGNKLGTISSAGCHSISPGAHIGRVKFVARISVYSAITYQTVCIYNLNLNLKRFYTTML